mgnify:CR=1 FL=1
MRESLQFSGEVPIPAQVWAMFVLRHAAPWIQRVPTGIDAKGIDTKAEWERISPCGETSTIVWFARAARMCWAIVGE